MPLTFQNPRPSLPTCTTGEHEALGVHREFAKPAQAESISPQEASGRRTAARQADKTMKRELTICALMACLLGCNFRANQTTTRAADEVEIYTLLFQQEIRPDETNRIHVLSIGTDTNQFGLIAPPPQVLEALSHLPVIIQTWPEIVPVLVNCTGDTNVLKRLAAIDATYPAVILQHMREPKTGYAYIHHEVRVLRWLSRSEVEIKVTTVGGLLSGRRFTTRLKRGKVGWIEGKHYDEWIS
jgi:hypothetical protein